MKSTKGKKVAAAITALVFALAAYTVFDNGRIAVKEQTVYIDNLPEAFDNFRILQMSDLHGKYFGQNQSRLAGLVNSIDYDMIAFTGDMEYGHDNDFTAFLVLLKGIENKNRMFYVNGNIDYAYSTETGSASDSGKELEDNGCLLLTEPFRLERDGQSIWIANYFSMSQTDSYLKDRATFLGSEAGYATWREYNENLVSMFSVLKGNGEIKICVTHMPFLKARIKDEGDYLDYSLILAGHYHGGQWRLPFYGALFIPGTDSEPSTLFPDQRDVMGLAEREGIQQYVSAGLGASIIPFRLVDTPEINIIILKAK